MISPGSGLPPRCPGTAAGRARRCDNGLYVLENGQLAEQGKHGELLEQKGLYAQMWAEYRKAASWKVGEAV